MRYLDFLSGFFLGASFDAALHDAFGLALALAAFGLALLGWQWAERGCK